VVELFDQAEAVSRHPFHDASPDPVGGPELTIKGVDGFGHETSIYCDAGDRPGPCGCAVADRVMWTAAHGGS